MALALPNGRQSGRTYCPMQSRHPESERSSPSHAPLVKPPPLVVIGASTAISFDPTSPFSKFTTLPIQIYQWTSRPQMNSEACRALHSCASSLAAESQRLCSHTPQPLQQEILSMSSNHNNHHKFVIETHDLDIFYGTFKAVTGVNMKVERGHKITAIIGPSGCGKSTLLRAFNRMNELYAAHPFRDRSCSRARISTPRRWIRPKSATALAWCSRNPILPQKHL